MPPARCAPGRVTLCRCPLLVAMYSADRPARATQRTYSERLSRVPGTAGNRVTTIMDTGIVAQILVEYLLL